VAPKRHPVLGRNSATGVSSQPKLWRQSCFAMIGKKTYPKENTCYT
jgi:hypothetical protein